MVTVCEDSYHFYKNFFKNILLYQKKAVPLYCVNRIVYKIVKQIVKQIVIWKIYL